MELAANAGKKTPNDPPTSSLLYQAGQGSAARLCIPEGGGLQTQIMRDHTCADHVGPARLPPVWPFRDKTHSLARLLVFWPSMTQTVADYVAGCPICHRVKADHTWPLGLFHALPLPSRRGGMLGIDFIGPLQASTEGS